MNLKNIQEQVNTISEKLKINQEFGDLQTQLNAIINQLKAVDYIQYPVCLGTVDIAAVCVKPTKEIMVMLGRKHRETQYQFPGGFKDVRETTEESAAREFHEEACYKINVDRLNYIGSMFIDDKRYADSVHKITTSMYIVYFTQEEMEKCCGGDDLAEVKWFSLDELITDFNKIIRPVHHKLFFNIVDKLTN